MKSNILKTRSTLTLVGAMALVLAMSAPAQAQATLTLTAPAGIYHPNDLVVFTLSLAGGVTVDSYSTIVSLDTQYFEFVGTSPFTPSAGAASAFPLALGPGFDPSQPGVLAINYGTFSAPSATSTLPLGTFTVQVVASTPIGGSVVGLSAPSGIGSDLPSNVHNGLLTSNANELVGVRGATLFVTPPVSAPEPSGALALMVGTAWLASALAGAQRRRRTAIRRKI